LIEEYIQESWRGNLSLSTRTCKDMLKSLRDDYPLMIDWAEKYRPKSLKDVAGNQAALSDLEEWARSWDRGHPKKNAVVLVGAPGVGKTSAALALANDFHWGTIEMNASDTRNAQAIKEVATLGSISETFTDKGEFLRSKEGGRKLIILDEADNLFGMEDFGGIGQIVETISITKQPIILIVNDYYGLTKRSSAIKKLCMTIKFERVSPASIKTALRNISRKEKIKASEEVLDYLAEHSSGDLRSAINDLQSISEGKKGIDSEDISSLGHRDARSTMFDVLSEVFRSSSCSRSRKVVSELDESPDRLIVWIDENLPLEYRRPEDLARAYEALSRADIFLGRVMKRQYFGLWAYASDMMTCGVSLARKGKFGGGRYQFPLWLAKMSRSRTLRNTISSLSKKIGDYCHTSREVANRDILPAFRYMYNKDRDFKLAMTSSLNLDEKEVAFLLGEREDSHAVKHLLEDVRKAKGIEAEEVRVFAEFEQETEDLEE